MNLEKYFKERISKKIWQMYFRRVGKMLLSLSKDERSDMLDEIQGHLYEEFQNQSADTEAERLLKAIEVVGEPEEYLRPMIAGHHLSKAVRTFNPISIYRGLFYNLSASVKSVLCSLIFSLFYLLVAALVIAASLRVLFPGHVGLFLNQSGGFLLGVAANPDYYEEEILGYWAIPIFLGTAALLYLVTTRMLLVLRKEK